MTGCGTRLQNEDAVDVDKRMVTLSGPSGPVSRKYDLLVGADGAYSLVRQAIVKRDKNMTSQLSVTAPMRYVTASGLEAQPQWLVPSVARITSPPLESLLEAPAVETGGAPALHCLPTVLWQSSDRSAWLFGCLAAVSPRAFLAHRRDLAPPLTWPSPRHQALPHELRVSVCSQACDIGFTSGLLGPAAS